jgi:hypothetical protein
MYTVTPEKNAIVGMRLAPAEILGQVGVVSERDDLVCG